MTPVQTLAAPPPTSAQTSVPSETDPQALKRTTVRGAFASGGAQAAAFVLRTGSMMIMARLLFPKDFGLFGMVVAFTGFLSLFRDFGLSMASVTRVSVTDDQLSTLFWVNVGVGAALAGISAAAAPYLAAFYGEPRLWQITMAVGGGFVFMGAGAQHRAILQRHMRFAALAVIDTLALAVGIGTGIVLAAIGTGYWALVAMTVVPQIVTTIGTWAVSGWMPGPPKRGTGVRSMLWYGGSVTFNALIVYVAYNLDKVLLGRFAGAAALGVYGRAYQLINLPTDSFTATVSQVAFPALAKLQNDPVRLRNYFLRAYSIFFAINLPITAGCALFARDIILVFMGPRWLEAVRIFQLLVPTTFVFALINPLGWMLMATGRISRSVQMALVIFPTVVLGYVAGLRNGAEGVALGFSTAMLVLALPMILWATHATVISAKDVLRSVAPALAAVVAAAGAVTIASAYTHSIEWTFGRLVTESAILFAVYWLVLLFVFGQLTTYATVLRELRIFPARVRSAGPATA